MAKTSNAFSSAPRFTVTNGAVLAGEEGNARERGLLEVARVQAGAKEILHLAGRELRRFGLRGDPGELRNLATGKQPPSAELAAWLATVEDSLRKIGDGLPSELDAESLEQLKALGYLD